jgi:cellulose synthase/poly-beta-1,6-N-acetylglucosamine synthase-like glycosyltransferase
LNVMNVTINVKIVWKIKITVKPAHIKTEIKMTFVYVNLIFMKIQLIFQNVFNATTNVKNVINQPQIAPRVLFLRETFQIIAFVKIIFLKILSTKQNV